MSKFRRQLMMANAVEPVPPTPVLPYDAEVEWIQTDGSAYIDTGVKPSSDTTFEIDAYIPEHGTSAFWVFGSRVSGSAGQFAYLNDGAQNVKSWRFGAGDFSSSPKLAEGWHHFDNTATPRILKIDDSITITAAANTFAQTNYPIFLLCLNISGTAAVVADGVRIGASKFYQNGTLVFDGIAVRKNGVGYLYDKVSGTLFGNAGTGAFTIGPDKIYDILIRSLTIANGQTPAIITDYYPNENTKVVCSCKLTERPSTSANKCLCGTFTYISSSLYRRFDVQFKNNLNVETNAGNGVNNKASVAYTVDTQINWEFGNGYIIKNGTRTSGTASSAFTADYPLVLFSNCNNGVPTISSTTASGFVGVIYWNIYIYEGSTLMRCYHPAKKNERVGLWESVTNQMLFSSYGEFSE